MIDVMEQQLETILGIINRFIPGCEIWAFGSRYKGSAKKYSDLDLVIVGDKNIDLKQIWGIKEELQESNIPFRVDILDWNAISPEFQNVIGQGYKVLQKGIR